MSLRLSGGESGSIRSPFWWMAMWWWNQHSVARLSGSWLPPSARCCMWWGWSRYRDVQPAITHPPSRWATRRRTAGGIARLAVDVMTGRPWVRPMICTDPVRSSSSSAAGPTRGPYSKAAPSSPPVPFASPRSTKIDTDDPGVASPVSARRSRSLGPSRRGCRLGVAPSCTSHHSARHGVRRCDAGVLVQQSCRPLAGVGPTGATMFHRASAGSTHNDPQTPAVRHDATPGAGAR
jgi:hypothetical protein